MNRPQPRPGILRIAPYVQGKSALPQHANPIKLSSNESAHGPSPRALEAYQAAAARLHRYPDGSQRELRTAIAEVHGLDATRIVCGNGSDELIDLLTRAYVGPGDELLLSQHHFTMCPIHAMVQGADVVLAPERGFDMDVEALLARVGPRTRMVVIANPTGTYLEQEQVRRLHAGLPPQVLLLLDGAYAEYVTKPDFSAGAELVTAHENVVMTRSFSKMYGLAALRIGWAYCPAAVIDVLQRARTPFNANGPAMAAAAAAVRDQEHVAAVRAYNARELDRVTNRLRALGLQVVPSVTNFYLIDFAATPGLSAVAAAAYMEAQGVIPRAAGSAQESVLRITVGLEAENDAALYALTAYVRGATALKAS